MGLYFLRARYYDPAAARFLNRDPVGLDAGDANLYRYAGNDPVNQIDPSGKRMLVPAGQSDPAWPFSWPSDALRDEIRDKFSGTLPVTASGRLQQSSRDEVTGQMYGVVDLFDGLPADFWGKVSTTIKTNSLAWKLNYAIEKDVVIVAAEDSQASNKTKLIWDVPQDTRSGWQQTVTNVIAVVMAAGAAAWNWGTETLKEGVLPVILVGLAALLDQAKARFPALDPQRFITLISKFHASAMWRPRRSKCPWTLPSISATVFIKASRSFSTRPTWSKTSRTSFSIGFLAKSRAASCPAQTVEPLRSSRIDQPVGVRTPGSWGDSYPRAGLGTR